MALGVVSVVVAATAVVGHTQPRSRPRAPSPTRTPAAKSWEVDTTPEQRDRAHAIFLRANDYYFKRDYTRALAMYQEALATFDHPRIRLAIVRSLIWLGRPADAYEHIEAALRWGREPFNEEEHADALSYREAVARQVAMLVIRCGSGHAHITLDGKGRLQCPGEVRTAVMPGQHQVVGRQPDHLTMTRDVITSAAEEVVVEVVLKTLEESAVKIRRWPVWKPWVVVAGGAVIAFVGVPVQLAAVHDIDEFRHQVAAACGTERCTPPADVFALESRAELKNRVALSLWIAGGAAIASGLVMAYRNREQTVIPSDETPRRRLTLVPMVSPHAASFALQGEF